MTACVNKKHSRRVAAAVSASLVGALTLGAAPVLAVAEEAPAETLDVLPSDHLDGVELTWSVEADRFGNYTAEGRRPVHPDLRHRRLRRPGLHVRPDGCLRAGARQHPRLDRQQRQQPRRLHGGPTKAGGYFAVVINGRVNLRHVTDFARASRPQSPARTSRSRSSRSPP